MTWTSPRTWVAGEKPSAATMNTHIRDNFKAIGDSWTLFTPSWLNVTLGTTGLVNSGRYVSAGKLTVVSFRLKLGTGGAFTSGPQMNVPIPAVATDSISVGTAFMEDSGGSTTRRLAMVYLGLAGTLQFTIADNAAGTQNVSAGSPWTWGVGDALAGTVTYEAA